MKYCCLIFLSLICALCSTSTPLRADQIPGNYGILHELVHSSFPPAIAFVLQEIAPGQVRQYRAVTVEDNANNNSGDPFGAWAFGAPIRVPDGAANGSVFHYAFFWANEASNFKTSTVKQQSYADLRLNSVDAEALNSDIIELDREIKNKRIEFVSRQDDFQAALAASPNQQIVEEIAALKRERALLQRALTEQGELIKRLELLVEYGREKEEPADIDALTKELSTHLREAAQVTAMADRLNTRRIDAAKLSFNRKLETVRAMEAEDPEGLAREILALRKKRRELETRLGINSAQAEAQNQF